MLGVARPSENFELRIEREPGRPGVSLTIFDFRVERGERSWHETVDDAKRHAEAVVRLPLRWSAQWSEPTHWGTIKIVIDGLPVDDERLPGPLRRAMTRVHADFEAMTDVQWLVRFGLGNDPDVDEGKQWVMCFLYGPTGMGISVPADTDEEEAAVFLADEWSEAVFETLAGETGWDAASHWPPCPRLGHNDHAVSPELRSGRAVWTCEDRSVVADIGGLSPAT